MSAPTLPGLHVRPMLSNDIERVMEIELSSYEHPWTEGIMRDCLRVRYSCHVVEIDGEIQGYLVMSEAAGEAHILNICIAPTWQGRGVGKILLKWAIALAKKASADTLFLEVRITNETAIHLYEVLGFNEIGVRRNYYPAGSDGEREDALLFARAL